MADHDAVAPNFADTVLVRLAGDEGRVAGRGGGDWDHHRSPGEIDGLVIGRPGAAAPACDANFAVFQA